MNSLIGRTGRTVVGMATPADVRRILAGRPETTEGPDPLRFRVAGKPVCWPWLERVPGAPRRLPNAAVLAVRVSGEDRKQDLLAIDADVIFTEPHYDGYPAVLVRLATIDVALLTDLLDDAWRRQAPRRLKAMRHPEPRPSQRPR
jgi:hypothetical protein